MDIFKKKVLLFPVCQSQHWFLVVVLLPELVKTQTAALVLNSINSDCDDDIKNISFYLQEELFDKKGVKIETMDLQWVVPQCPKQDDGSSCGIFLLHFAEMIFSR